MREKSILRDEFYQLGKIESCSVCDLHGHMGPIAGIHLPYCEADDMAEHLRKRGVKRLVFSHHGALMSPDIGNQASRLAVEKYPDLFRAYLGFNPHYPEVFEEEIKTWTREVFAGLKFLSDYHLVKLSDDRYRPAWEFAHSMKLPVLIHTWGGSSFDGPEQIRLVARNYSSAWILLGHSCHGDWPQAISLVKEFPNVYLELCAVLDERGILEKIVEEIGADRIIFGTDFPWFSYSYYLGALLDAEIGDQARRKILSENALRVIPFLLP
ncbi:MAG: amidohydrolase family protein [Candidatus Omnitrophica bacterium]|nr:amidohydrolase family protein [Candidatus Omnitrophota bacterium]